MKESRKVQRAFTTSPRPVSKTHTRNQVPWFIVQCYFLAQYANTQSFLVFILALSFKSVSGIYHLKVSQSHSWSPSLKGPETGLDNPSFSFSLGCYSVVWDALLWERGEADTELVYPKVQLFLEGLGHVLSAGQPHSRGWGGGGRAVCDRGNRNCVKTGLPWYCPVPAKTRPHAQRLQALWENSWDTKAKMK